MATLAALVLLLATLATSAHDMEYPMTQRIAARMLLQSDANNSSVIAVQVPDADQFVTPQACDTSLDDRHTCCYSGNTPASPVSTTTAATSRRRGREQHRQVAKCPAKLHFHRQVRHQRTQCAVGSTVYCRWQRRPRLGDRRQAGHRLHGQRRPLAVCRHQHLRHCHPGTRHTCLVHDDVQ